MSAVLGPIHQWMYHKVMTMEELIQAVIRTAEEENWGNTVNGKELSSYTKESFPALEEVIDLGNIHGSISGMIDDVESRYAELVTGLLQGHEERLETLKQTAYIFGTTHKLDAAANAQDAFKAMNDLMLDGMPCDRALQITSNEESRVAFQMIMDLHAGYWTDCQGDRDNYYALRAELLRGVFAGSGYTFTDIGDGQYEIAAA